MWSVGSLRTWTSNLEIPTLLKRFFSWLSGRLWYHLSPQWLDAHVKETHHRWHVSFWSAPSCFERPYLERRTEGHGWILLLLGTCIGMQQVNMTENTQNHLSASAWLRLSAFSWFACQRISKQASLPSFHLLLQCRSKRYCTVYFQVIFILYTLSTIHYTILHKYMYIYIIIHIYTTYIYFIVAYASPPSSLPRCWRATSYGRFGISKGKLPWRKLQAARLYRLELDGMDMYGWCYLCGEVGIWISVKSEFRSHSWR